MSALNPPQFRLSRSHTPRKAQPVPPVHQPEVAARAAVCTSTPRRRTVWVAPSTVGTVVGGTVAPRLLDLSLGRTDHDAQQTDETEQPERPGCPDSPVPGDHGPYGGQTHARRLQPALSAHRPVALLDVTAAAVGAVAANRARANR